VTVKGAECGIYSLVYISVAVADYIHETNDCCGNTADWMEKTSKEAEGAAVGSPFTMITIIAKQVKVIMDYTV